MAEFYYSRSAEVYDVQQEMKKLLEYMGGAKPPIAHFAPSMWEPAVDVYETEDEIVALVELAGVNPSEVRIILDGRMLTIRGVREERAHHSRRIYHYMEIRKGLFERNLLLPAPVDESRSVSSMEDGCLKIILPKVKHEQVVHIEWRTSI